MSEYLEISAHQARRYRNDIEQAGFYIDSKYGTDGGYRLIDPLDKNLMMPDNIILALSLSAKNNESLLKKLSKSPVTPQVKRNVSGDNSISNHATDVMSIIANAINTNKTISFKYDMYNKQYYIECEPYKLMYSNHSYYLRGVSKYQNELRRYDIEKIHNVEIISSFVPCDEIIKKTNEELLIYGLMDDAILI